jgi:hypothetical protein
MAEGAMQHSDATVSKDQTHDTDFGKGISKEDYGKNAG